MRTLFIFMLLVSCSYIHAQTGDTHPSTGKYNVYRFDSYGNSTYAFNFTLIRKSADNKTGLYELEIGNNEKDKGQSSGEYQYDAATKTISWLSGPFTVGEYKPGPANKDAGKVLQKGTKFTIILSNNYRGSSGQ
jgi:hypothetical protein